MKPLVETFILLVILFPTKELGDLAMMPQEQIQPLVE